MKEIDWRREFNLYKNRLLHTKGKQDLLNEIVNGITHHFPFERVSIFSYDTEIRIKQGITGTGFECNEITSIREDIRECRAFFIALLARNTVSFNNLTIEKLLPDKYLQKYSLQSVIIQPLLTAHNINGFLLLDQRRCVSDLNPELFSLLQIIGKEVGTLLQTRGIFPCALGNLNSDTALSPRELQVLQGLAYGYSIQEIADLLSISNLTVRDYCSSLIKKLGAQDRSHAVAIGLRKGLIF